MFRQKNEEKIGWLCAGLQIPKEAGTFFFTVHHSKVTPDASCVAPDFLQTDELRRKIIIAYICHFVFNERTVHLIQIIDGFQCSVCCKRSHSKPFGVLTVKYVNVSSLNLQTREQGAARVVCIFLTLR